MAKSYAQQQVDSIRGDEHYRLQIRQAWLGDEATKWINVTPEQLDAIHDILGVDKFARSL